MVLGGGCLTRHVTQIVRYIEFSRQVLLGVRTRCYIREADTADNYVFSSTINGGVRVYFYFRLEFEGASLDKTRRDWAIRSCLDENCLILQIERALRLVNVLVSCLRLKYEEQLVFLPEDNFFGYMESGYIENIDSAT